MLTNTTTWEKAARQRITYLKTLKNDSFNPFHEGYCWNILHFLCYFKDIKWETVYKGVLNPNGDNRTANDDNYVHTDQLSSSSATPSSDEDDDITRVQMSKLIINESKIQNETEASLNENKISQNMNSIRIKPLLDTDEISINETHN